MDFFISLFCGLIALGVVWYGFMKALNKAAKIDDFVINKLKWPWLSEWIWWLFPWFFLYTVVKLVQTIVTLIDPSITF